MSIVSHGRIKRIIWHCAATRPSSKATARDVRKWHKDRGWGEIGYHYVIERDGRIVPGRAISIAGVQSGAHTKGKNGSSVGVCIMGGLHEDGSSWTDGGWMTLPQQKAAIDLCRVLKAMYPKATHHGHNEFAAKDCPCFPVADLVMAA